MPTPWPFMVVLGIALILAGVVTHAVVSIVGAAVLLSSSVGWWCDALPKPKEEAVPLTPDDQVSKSSLPVDHLAAGHRIQIPVEVHPYWTGIWGGPAGAVAMAVVAMFFRLISQGSIWYPINLSAAGVVRSLAEALSNCDTLVKLD